MDYVLLEQRLFTKFREKRECSMGCMEKVETILFFARIAFWFAVILFIASLTLVGITMVQFPDKASNFYGGVILIVELTAGIYVCYARFQRWYHGRNRTSRAAE